MIPSARQRPELLSEDSFWKQPLLLSVIIHATLLWGTTAWWQKTYRTAGAQPQVIEIEVVERPLLVPVSATLPEPQSMPSPATDHPAVVRGMPAQVKPLPLQRRAPPLEQASPTVRTSQPAISTRLEGVEKTSPVSLHGDEPGPSPAVTPGPANPPRDHLSHPYEQVRLSHGDDHETDIRQAYQQQLRELIERRKRYPLMARKGRQQGRVVVEFSIHETGEVISAQVAQSSGYRLLDRAALKAVSDIEKFPPPPAAFSGDTHFRVSINFSLE